jgi:hypothetical protein
VRRLANSEEEGEILVLTNCICLQTALLRLSFLDPASVCLARKIIKITLEEIEADPGLLDPKASLNMSEYDEPAICVVSACGKCPRLIGSGLDAVH